MDIQPKQPISDDQELAKVLAGITAGADGSAPTNLADDLEEENAGSNATDEKANEPAADTPTTSASDDATNSPIDKIESTVATEGQMFSAPTAAPAAPAANNALDAIKHDALNELRPLVDKLNLSAEEKFDTYLLIIRSTDDATLVGPAFEAARAIADEAGKAQALFEIVKEIDYLSNPQKPTA